MNIGGGNDSGNVNASDSSDNHNGTAKPNNNGDNDIGNGGGVHDCRSRRPSVQSV